MRADEIVRAGEVTEIVGRLSSGRTSLLLAALERTTRVGAAVALVDADDAFDPAGAARAGVDLTRVLWVRCARRRDVALRAADVLVRCPGFALVALDLGELVPRLPLTAAFRLRLAVHRSRVALVVLAARRIAGAGAALAVETVQAGVDWRGPARAATRLARLRSHVRVVRARGRSGAEVSRGATSGPGHASRDGGEAEATSGPGHPSRDGGEAEATSGPGHPSRDRGEAGATLSAGHPSRDRGEAGAISGPGHASRDGGAWGAISGPTHLEWWCA